jgi:hypothetical protein
MVLIGKKLKDEEEKTKKIPPPTYIRAISDEARSMTFSCNGFPFMRITPVGN